MNKLRRFIDNHITQFLPAKTDGSRPLPETEKVLYDSYSNKCDFTYPFIKEARIHHLKIVSVEMPGELEFTVSLLREEEESPYGRPGVSREFTKISSASSAFKSFEDAGDSAHDFKLLIQV